MSWPDVAFRDPSWGEIVTDRFDIDINLGEADPVKSILFHVRGEDEAASVVARIAAQLGFRVLDMSTGEIWEEGQIDLSGFQEWRRFRNRVIGQ
jgi:hypothetical protein